MATLSIKDGTDTYIKDWGTGRGQMLFLGDGDYRVIAHDRRGHGTSSEPWDGNEMDTYADDLTALINKLDLKVYAGARHGMCTTLSDQVNADLLAFIKS